MFPSTFLSLDLQKVPTFRVMFPSTLFISGFPEGTREHPLEQENQVKCQIPANASSHICAHI